MKQIALFSFFVFFLHTAGRGQINFVRNPSFEQYSACPDNWDEAKYCNHWMGLDTAWNPPDWAHATLGVPEYINTCSSSSLATAPHGHYFFHNPRHGEGMMQLITYWNNGDVANARDYLQSRLFASLTMGHKYSVRFYTSLAQAGFYAVNGIGAYLDDGTIDTTHQYGAVQSQYTPQVVDTSIINDTLNWVMIEDTFTANGTEKFITIGQFFDRAHTDTLRVAAFTGRGEFYTWYLIDDVSVIDCDSEPFAGNDTLIHPGDSAFIGPHEILLPYTWYVLGSSIPIDSGGGIWVRPTSTTTYVLKQILCGVTKYDTIKVRVWPDTVTSVGSPDSYREFAVGSLRVYPNPAAQEMIVEGARGLQVSILDLLGREMLVLTIDSDKKVLNVSGLPGGIYVVQVIDRTTGVKYVQRLQKE